MHLLLTDVIAVCWCQWVHGMRWCFWIYQLCFRYYHLVVYLKMLYAAILAYKFPIEDRRSRSAIGFWRTNTKKPPPSLQVNPHFIMAAEPARGRLKTTCSRASLWINYIKGEISLPWRKCGLNTLSSTSLNMCRTSVLLPRIFFFFK